MKSPIVGLFIAFSLILAPVAAHGASASSTGPNRYYLTTTKTFWKNAFGARHSYEGGFTANLSDIQAKVARFAGLRPIAVKAFNILDTVTPSPSPKSSASQRTKPTVQIGWGVRLMAGDQAGTRGGSGVTVAIVDTGVDINHQDIADRIDGCSDYSDQLHAFMENACSDVNGHGTHVAGIVAADGGRDAAGMVGFAPTASISVFKVCDVDGVCYGDDVAAAITDAVNQGSNIIVLGMGGEQKSSFVDEALAYATEHNVLVIAAAGNDGPYSDSVDWPARDPRVVSVGALTPDETVADFSSHGNNESTKAYTADSGDVELVAPGVNIESTYLNGDYAILSGTSMAAPAIAGLAARVWQSKAKNPAQATRILLHELTHDVAPTGDDNSSGWGIPKLINIP